LPEAALSATGIPAGPVELPPQLSTWTAWDEPTGQMTRCAVRYDWTVSNRVVSATELKAKCLALLDEVSDSGAAITVTKRGRPVATLRPMAKQPPKSPKGAWIGKVEIVGDIVRFDTTRHWEALRKH
jgi:prevent-host-death family protein